MSLYRVAVSCDTIPLHVCVPCPDLRDNNSPKTSLYRVPGINDINALKSLFAVCQIDETIFPLKRPVPCAWVPSHNCLKTSVCRVPGLHDTIALKRLYTMCQIFVRIFPLYLLCTLF